MKLAISSPAGNPQVPPAGPDPASRLRTLLQSAPPWTGIGVLVVVMFVGMSIGNEYFLNYANLNNVLRGAVVPLLLALGTTFVITTGMIDLSLGSLLALDTVLMLGFMNAGLPVPVAVLATLAASALLAGLVNGLLIARFQLFFMVVTLGTMSIFRSVAQLGTDGTSVQLYDRAGFDFVLWLGDGSVGPVSVPVVLAAILLAASVLLMRFTTFGRNLLAVGGNAGAARLAGVPVERVQILAFALNGLFIGVAAVVMAGRIQAASPSIGIGMELSVIAAVLLGGSSFMGGNSTFLGTLIGVVFVSLLDNALNLLQVQTFWQGVVTGAVLIVAVGIDRLRARSRT
ncbi:ABC transporter permease [Actinocorallia libanotica]|uniref:Ribose ABC transporter permease n=1 Tax=Actinocorallia libanotica TaxID=46162 RepID=A0ABN1RS52_9ACTN